MKPAMIISFDPRGDSAGFFQLEMDGWRLPY
jgi:hypothetical protein